MSEPKSIKPLLVSTYVSDSLLANGLKEIAWYDLVELDMFNFNVFLV